MELIPQTVVRMKIVKRNGYCPVFSEGQEIVIKKHCFDTTINTLQKYCYATLADVYPLYYSMRKQPVGSKTRFSCRDNGIIEIEVERLSDEVYDYENH
jgi:uncharacterized repeat protein (TIGR04076 family)